MKKLIILAFVATAFFSCKKDKDSSPKTKTVYQTDFSTNDGKWYIDKDASDSLTAVIEGNAYHVRNLSKINWQYFYTNSIFTNDTGNTAVETNVLITPINNNTNAYGGIIWGNNHNTGVIYIFGCYTDGYYDVWGYPNGKDYKEYKPATESSALHKNGSNVLRIELKAGTLHFLINGTEVFNMPSNVSTLDNTGVAVDAESDAKFDYFKGQIIP